MAHPLSEMVALLAVLWLAFTGSILAADNISYVSRACSVYCTGPILEAVQLSGIFPDSKTFVDMPMIYEPETTLDAFNNLTDPSNVTVLEQFLEEYFLPASSDLVDWFPTDFSTTPSILSMMDDSYIYKNWTKDLNELWKVLGRQVASNVTISPEKHSFLPRSHPMIVPGGRFRESYYWDSYWIVRGLLVCDMNTSALAVMSNLLDDISNFGFVPNGGRIYYLDRSQPPLLSEMVLAYLDYYMLKHGWDQDLEGFLDSALTGLQLEYTWWMNSTNGHTVELFVDGQNHTLNRYYSNYTTPRPESYLADIDHSLQNTRTSEEIDAFYGAVRAGAETGWDFSSRWIAEVDGMRDNVSFIDTSSIIPVELNTILYKMELNIAKLAEILGYLETKSAFQEAAGDRLQAIQGVLWDEAAFRWADYNITTGAQADRGTEQTIAYYLPIWAGILPPTPVGEAKDLLVASLNSSGLIQVAGVQTTTVVTAQQWDSPNAWAPLVLMTIEGLYRLQTSSADELAVSPLPLLTLVAASLTP